ncbi:Diamine acetyltransferase 2 [Operophtera brumata]|uniref:Diamine acetyltransferase 2 n=1 Tax=Operophtera brumata TaxID=104452 RepID=A0A0L7KXM2_OPEBR|nr:Diamine acetyltransferase 2 [Operophtera brumata]
MYSKVDLAFIIAEAAGIGSRLDFHVLEWNPARAFYEARGALNLTQREHWCYYRLAGDALHALARSTLN